MMAYVSGDGNGGRHYRWLSAWKENELKRRNKTVKTAAVKWKRLQKQKQFLKNIKVIKNKSLSKIHIPSQSQKLG